MLCLSLLWHLQLIELKMGSKRKANAENVDPKAYESKRQATIARNRGKMQASSAKGVQIVCSELMQAGCRSWVCQMRPRQ